MLFHTFGNRILTAIFFGHDVKIAASLDGMKNGFCTHLCTNHTSKSTVLLNSKEREIMNNRNRKVITDPLLAPIGTQSIITKVQVTLQK